jgi:hypothetical protein
MSQINPFIGSILQTPQVQRQQSVEKDRQVQRNAEQAKDAALTDDRLEHQVESSEELTPVHEQERRERRFKRQQQHPKSDESKDEGQEDSHLDLTA